MAEQDEDRSVISAEARRIAEAFLDSDHARWGNRHIDSVVAPPAGSYLNIYAAGFDPSQSWVCHFSSPNPRPDGTWVIASSDVVLVDMASGRVVYAGSAGDEG